MSRAWVPRRAGRRRGAGHLPRENVASRVSAYVHGNVRSGGAGLGGAQFDPFLGDAVPAVVAVAAAALKWQLTH